MAKTEYQLTTAVDQALLSQAEAQIYQLLLKQRRAFNQRWQHNRTMNKVKPWIRYFGLGLSVLGLLLMWVMWFGGFGWVFKPSQQVLLSLVFVLLLILYYYLPRAEQAIYRWTDRVSQKSCRKLAKKCIRQADKMAPFEAHYEIKGDLISYYRCQEHTADEPSWEFAWNRRLQGHAIQAQNATVLFKKATSIAPQIVILQAQAEPLAGLLKQLKITVEAHAS